MSAAHEPTEEKRKTVEALSGYGIPQTDISVIIGISVPTLLLYYRGELDRGSAVANAKVAQRLFDIATKGQGREAITACIFWAKTRMGWRETPHDVDLPPYEKMGKKEQVMRAAASAGDDTDWGEDLRFDGISRH